MKKIIILLILFAGFIFPQIQQRHLSVIKKRGGGPADELLYPTGQTAQPPYGYQAWTPSSGTEQDCIAADDASYITTASTYSKQLYVIANTSAASGKTINYVEVHAMMKSDTTVNDFWFLISSPTTVTTGTEIANITKSYVEYSEQWETNPWTSEAWTSTDIDAMGIGLSSRGGVAAGDWYCDKLWLVVNYQ